MIALKMSLGIFKHSHSARAIHVAARGAPVVRDSSPKKSPVSNVGHTESFAPATYRVHSTEPLRMTKKSEPGSDSLRMS